MAQEFLDIFGVDVSGQEQRRARVPEIVESYLRKSSLLEKWFEGTLYKVFWVDRRTNARGDDQVVVLI